MEFIRNVLKGMLVGIGAVAPGVSGGTFAVILGIYDKLTDAIANFYKNFKRKLLFLIPIGLGVVIGVLGFSRIMKTLFETHEVEMKFMFIGLMLGTLPAVLRDANKQGFKWTYILPFCVTLGGSILAMSFEADMVVVKTSVAPDFILRGVFGVLIGFGTIVPGISSSFMLMAVGGYEHLLEGIVNLDVTFMFPVLMGFGLSILLFAKVINLLFKHFYGITYYGILGFVIGSIGMILPYNVVWMELLVGGILFFAGFMFSLKLNKIMG